MFEVFPAYTVCHTQETNPNYAVSRNCTAEAAMTSATQLETGQTNGA